MTVDLSGRRLLIFVYRYRIDVGLCVSCTSDQYGLDNAGCRFLSFCEVHPLWKVDFVCRELGDGAVEVPSWFHVHDAMGGYHAG